MTAPRMHRYLEVVEFDGRKVVRRLDVTEKSDRAVERIEMALLRQTDRDRFFVRDVRKRLRLPPRPPV